MMSKIVCHIVQGLQTKYFWHPAKEYVSPQKGQILESRSQQCSEYDELILKILKGVLHPRPVFWLFMHFSQKLQHIGSK